MRCDVTKLLKSIRGISNQIDTNTSKCLKKIKKLVAIVEYYRGDLFTNKALLDHEEVRY